MTAIRSNIIIICIVSFFLYSGFYAGLEILIELISKDASRFYTIPIRILCSVLCLVYIFSILYKGEVKFKKKSVFLFIPTLLFLLLLLSEYLINIHNNIDIQQSYEYSLYILVYGMIPFIFYAFLDLRRYQKHIIYSNILAGFLLSTLSIVFYKDVIGSVGRISELQYQGDSGFISPLALSYSASLTIVLSFFQILSRVDKKKVKYFLVLAIILSLVNFLLGASRGAILTTISCLLIYFLTLNLKKILSGISVFLIIITGAYYAALYFGSSVFIRFLGIGDDYTNNSSSVTARLDIWEGAISAIKKSFFLGGNFEVNGVYPHNLYLEAFMSTGVLGFILFIFITFFSLGLSIYIYLKNQIFLPFVIITHGIVMGLVSGSLYTSILLFSGIGMVLSVYRKN